MAALIVGTLCSLSVPFCVRLRLRHLADVCLNCQVSFSRETTGEIKVRLATPAAPGCHLISILWQWRSGRFKENRGRGRCLTTTEISRYHLPNLAGGCEYGVTVVEVESGNGETGWNPRLVFCTHFRTNTLVKTWIHLFFRWEGCSTQKDSSEADSTLWNRLPRGCFLQISSIIIYLAYPQNFHFLLPFIFAHHTSFTNPLTGVALGCSLVKSENYPWNK